MTDRRTDGQTDRRTDRQTDGRQGWGIELELCSQLKTIHINAEVWFVDRQFHTFMTCPDNNPRARERNMTSFVTSWKISLINTHISECFQVCLRIYSPRGYNELRICCERTNEIRMHSIWEPHIHHILNRLRHSMLRVFQLIDKQQWMALSGNTN